METIASFIPLIIIILLVSLIIYSQNRTRDKKFNKNHTSQKNSFFDSFTDIIATIMDKLWKTLQFLIALGGLLLLAIGYIYNLIAVFNHWGEPITMQYLAEFIGVILIPIGIIIGWIYILLDFV